MVIRKNPAHDTENPPGQVVVPVGTPRPAHMEKSLGKNIEDYIMDTEEVFAPWPFPSSAHSLKPCVNTGQFAAGECEECSKLYNPTHGGYPGTVHVDEGKEHNEDDAKVVLMKDFFKEKPE